MDWNEFFDDLEKGKGVNWDEFYSFFEKGQYFDVKGLYNEYERKKEMDKVNIDWPYFWNRLAELMKERASAEGMDLDKIMKESQARAAGVLKKPVSSGTRKADRQSFDAAYNQAMAAAARLRAMQPKK